MAADQLRIDSLRLRVPGLGRGEARQLGEEVARRLASELPGAIRPGRLGMLDLRAAIPAGTPRNRLPDLIAAAIRRALV